MAPVVETINLTKTYDGTTVVDKLNLSVEEGEIFGFLGPNGAGKTTSILMILGLTEPTEGVARVQGYDATREPLKVKRIAGYLPENVGFYGDMTARENLRYVTRLNRIPDKVAEQRIEDALASVGLSQAVEQEVGTFSRGMKQRLGIADVLIKDPALVFLDEPTLGIDPDGANYILNLIVTMARERGISVVISSHFLHQVQRICDRVGIMSKGHMVAEGSIQRLGQEILSGGQNLLEVRVSEMNDQVLERIKAVEGVKEVKPDGAVSRISSDRDVSEAISRAIFDSGVVPTQIRSQDYTLEELYMRYFREE
ncbi:MAG: ABC transporter ATP-binding protein [Dehalococcoidia bacterium]